MLIGPQTFFSETSPVSMRHRNLTVSADFDQVSASAGRIAPIGPWRSSTRISRRVDRLARRRDADAADERVAGLVGVALAADRDRDLPLAAAAAHRRATRWRRRGR